MAFLWLCIVCCLALGNAQLDVVKEDIISVCNSLNKNIDSCTSLLTETASHLFSGSEDADRNNYDIKINYSNEMDVLQYYTLDLITSCSGNRKCIKSIKESISSFKLKLFYELIYGNYFTKFSVLYQEMLNVGLNDVDRSMLSIEKAIMLQDIVDNPKVEVMCEIGLTTGIVSSFLLLTNPLAELLSFDLLLNNSTIVASKALLDYFNDRGVNIILGPGSYSIRNLSQLIVTKKCNVIYINGGLYNQEDLLYDLQNLRSLVNESHNQVIIDHNPLTNMQALKDKLRRDNRANYRYFANLKWNPHNSTKGYVFDAGTADGISPTVLGFMDICSYVF